MVNSWVKFILLTTIGISTLNLYGQAGVIEQKIISMTCEVNDITKELEDTIEDKLNLSEDMEWMTSQNLVLEVQYSLGHITVNLHPDIIGYGGGTHTEYVIGELIMESVFENDKVESLTILVDGKKDIFPEGSNYSYCTREHYNTYYKLPKQLNDEVES